MSRSVDEIVDLVAARIRGRLTGAEQAPAPPGAAASAAARSPLSPTSTAAARRTDERPGAGGSSWKRPTSTRDKPWLRKRAERQDREAGGQEAEAGLARELVRMIDHTQLRANATREEILRLCVDAREHGFFSVCVNSTHVSTCTAALRGSETLVCAVVGFPLGAMSPSAKAYEAREAVRAGAGEIDMVMNIGALKSGDYALAVEDMRQVVQASAPARVKVILETGALTDEEKAIACALAKVAGAAFVKTSTGFGQGGATVADVELMKRIVGNDMEVKASGGIRTRDDALAMRKAGATRIGTSSSVAIVTGAGGGKKKPGGY